MNATTATSCDVQRRPVLAAPVRRGSVRLGSRAIRQRSIRVRLDAHHDPHHDARLDARLEERRARTVIPRSLELGGTGAGADGHLRSGPSRLRRARSTDTFQHVHETLSSGTLSSGTGSLGTGSLGTGSLGTGSLGTGSLGTGSLGTGSLATARVRAGESSQSAGRTVKRVVLRRTGGVGPNALSDGPRSVGTPSPRPELGRVAVLSNTGGPTSTGAMRGPTAPRLSGDAAHGVQPSGFDAGARVEFGRARTLAVSHYAFAALVFGGMFFV